MSEPRTNVKTAYAAGKSVVAQAGELIQAERYGEAVALLEHALLRAPTDTEFHYLLGVAAFRSNDLTRAESAFKQATECDPAHAFAQYGLGLIYRQIGQSQQAQQAFQATLRADPNMEEARRQLTDLASQEAMSQSPAGESEPTPVAGSPAATGAAHSLAELLDARGTPRPDEGALVGRLVWTGQPSPRTLAGAIAGAILLILAPRLLYSLASSLPSGPARDFGAGLWRVIEAASWPAALTLLVLSATRLMTRRYVLREHRIDVFAGLIRRTHLALWLHDLERPVMVQQNLWHIVLGLGTVEIHSTILPSLRGRRRAGRPGRLLLSGLPIAVAEQVAAIIRAEALWQRRRMVQNFVSSR